MENGKAEGTALFRSFPFWVSLFSDSYSEAFEVLFERLFTPALPMYDASLGLRKPLVVNKANGGEL